MSAREECAPSTETLPIKFWKNKSEHFNFSMKMTPSAAPSASPRPSPPLPSTAPDRPGSVPSHRTRGRRRPPCLPHAVGRTRPKQGENHVPERCRTSPHIIEPRPIHSAPPRPYGAPVARRTPTASTAPPTKPPGRSSRPAPRPARTWAAAGGCWSKHDSVEAITRTRWPARPPRTTPRTAFPDFSRGSQPMQIVVPCGAAIGSPAA